MSKGSPVWYRQESNTVYKPGVITHLNDSNVTISMVSGHDIILPRPSGEYPPLVINDDSFIYINSKVIPGIYIAAFNQSNVYYLGSAAKGLTT